MDKIDIEKALRSGQLKRFSIEKLLPRIIPMISNNLIFSKSAALRILKFATKIEALRVFKGSIQVTYLTKNGRCSTFLSKKAFFQDFLFFRQEGAKNVTVRCWRPGTYQCRYDCISPNGENTRTVDLSGGTASCSCPDHEEQYRILGKVRPGCKHILAVMTHLGYSSLAQYLDAMAQKARGDLFGGGWDEQPQHLVEPHRDFIDDINQILPQLAVVSGGKKKKQCDPFGGFNF